MRKTTLTTNGKGTLVQHPEDLPKGSWQRITILTKEAGQPRPYADSRYVYEITFEGGTPSTRDGWDFPFATRPPYKPLSAVVKESGGAVIFQTPSEDVQRERHTQHIKDTCRALTIGWRSEKDSPERQWPDTYLETFECIEREPTHTTYRVVVITPYID